jgi:uncharacterized membrane protein YqjE
MSTKTENGQASARSTAELVMDVADDLRMLLRKEIELARLELMEGLKAQLIGVGIIGLALISILPALLFAVIALALWLPFSREVSFAIVAGGMASFTVVGVGIGIWVMRRRRVRLDRSIDSIKEDVRWARDQMTR